MSAGTSSRNHFLDILKGSLIFCVIIHHFKFPVSIYLKYLCPLWIMMTIPLYMIISGYVNHNSFKKNGISSLSECYLPKNIVNKVLRFTIPFAIAFVAELIFYNIVGDRLEEFGSPLAAIRRFIRGGLGPGSYYYPLMIQFIFVFPVIFTIIKKHKFKGVIMCGALNLIYEILVYAYNMNEGCYRLLIFRFLLVIAVGCYLASEDFRFHVKLGIICMILGATFIIATAYYRVDTVIFGYWTEVSMAACLFYIPIAVFAIKKFSNAKFAPLELLGKASYDIFLAQMLWYRLFSRTLYYYISDRGIQFAITLPSIIAIGVLFYFIETPITKKITKLVYKKFKLN